MIKILKVIDTCHDCFHCKAFIAEKDNYTAIKICDFAGDTGRKIHSPFLLELTISKGSTALPIPENCPLENYKSSEQ